MQGIVALVSGCRWTREMIGKVPIAYCLATGSEIDHTNYTAKWKRRENQLILHPPQKNIDGQMVGRIKKLTKSFYEMR